MIWMLKAEEIAMCDARVAVVCRTSLAWNLRIQDA